MIFPLENKVVQKIKSLIIYNPGAFPFSGYES